MRPKFCVLLAVYNGKKYVKEQLQSILDQHEVEGDIFVNIDKSADGSEKMILEWEKCEPRIHLLSTGHRFGGAAANFFRLIADLDFSEFEYICFADQDDIWLPNKLLRAHEVLSSTGVDGYSSNVTAFWPDGRQALIEKSQQQVRWDFLFEAAGPGCTYVMKKELACAVQNVVRSRWSDVQEVGLHDWFTYAFARANGYRWVIDDVPSMLYRQHANNQVGVNAGWPAFKHRADKILSGWGLAQSAMIARLVGLGDDPFVLRWSRGSRLGLLYLALQAGQCRRHLRDKFIFALSCLVLSLMRRRHR